MIRNITNNTRNKAFTLAEILLTLMIIGIVAAMTIPGLMNNTSDKELKTAYAKDYAILSQAMNMVLQDQGGTLKNIGLTKDGSALKDYFKAYLSYTKDCNTYYTDGICWNKLSNILFLNYPGYSGWPGGELAFFPGLVLANGSYVLIRPDVGACTGSSWSGTKDCGQMYVDVNGAKGPNTVGRDIFGMWIKENQIAPFGSNDNFRNDCSTTASSSGWGCAYKALNNIDY